MEHGERRLSFLFLLLWAVEACRGDGVFSPQDMRNRMYCMYVQYCTYVRTVCTSTAYCAVLYCTAPCPSCALQYCKVAARWLEGASTHLCTFCRYFGAVSTRPLSPS